MEAAQLFIDIDKADLDNDWYSTITAALKKLNAIKQIEVVEQNEQRRAEIQINYQVKDIAIDEILRVVASSKATVTSINIHFPSSITGISNAYGASGISITLHEGLKQIHGVLESSLSSSGVLKIFLDILNENKQRTITEVLKILAK